MSNQVQAMTIAMFGAAAGGYTAELETSVAASGVAAVANSIMGLQQPLLGIDLSDNSVWTDFVLANLGIADTNAAYGTAAAYFAARFVAGATRGDIIAEAVAYLSGTVSAEFTAVAAAFVTKVEDAEAWSIGDGAAVIGITDLIVGAGNVPVSSVFNLTAALATLTAANDAEEAFLSALDLDADGEADNAGNAAANDVALTNAVTVAYGDVDALVGGAAYQASNTDAVNAALLSNQQIQNTANLTIANNNLTAATAAVAAVDGLADAIADYEAAVDAEDAATTANDLAVVALTAALDTYNINSSAATDVVLFAGDYETVIGATLTIDVTDDVAELAAGVTETTNPGITALLAAVQAQLTTGATLTAAMSDVADAYTALDLADGGAVDGGLEDDSTVNALDTATYQALLDAEGAVETAQTAIDDLAEAVTALAEVNALATTREGLGDDVAAAEDAIGLQGYDLNDGEGQFDGNGDGDFADDVDVNFALTTDANENEVLTVDFGTDSFTMSAGDVISVGGFTYNDGDVATDGNNSALEFFLNETLGGNLEVIFETSVFGSNAVVAETETITLIGLSLEDVTIGANYITLA